jgi:hypothetical protein
MSRRPPSEGPSDKPPTGPQLAVDVDLSAFFFRWFTQQKASLGTE